MEARIEVERVGSSGCQEMHDGLPSLTRPQTMAPTVRSIALWRASQRPAERPLRRRFGGTIGRPLAYPLVRAWDSIAPEGIPGLRRNNLGSRVGLTQRRDSAVPGASFDQARVAKCAGRGLVAGKKTPQTSRGQLRQMFIASRVAKSLVVWVGAELVVDCLRKLSGAGSRGTCWGCGPGHAPNVEYRYCLGLPQLASIDRIGAFVSGQTVSLVLAIGEWGG